MLLWHNQCYISLVAHKLHRSNSQTLLLYPFRFSTDILFSSLVSFNFCHLVLGFALKLKIFILLHIWLCRWVSDKEIFTRLISGNKTTFFVLIYKSKKILKFYFNWRQFVVLILIILIVTRKGEGSQTWPVENT